MPTPEYHALLSPSSAARWLNCPASVLLTKDMPETTSKDAEKGRLAHSIAELKARKKFGVPAPMSKRTYESQLGKLQNDPLYEKAMDGNTDLYVEVLTEHAMSFKEKPFTSLETRVPIGLFTAEHKEDGSPSEGTADCIQIGEGVIWVTDYKNGSGVPVSAEDNPQMKLYALGALALYRPFYGESIKTIRMTIVQPNLSSVTDWETTREELEAWSRDMVAPAAAKVWNGCVEQNPGEWCKSHFCPIRATCRTLANNMMSLEEFKRSLPPTLAPSEIGDILTRGQQLVSWYKTVDEYALAELLAGRPIPGWKVVEGRGGREWDDTDKAFTDIMAAGIAEAILYERKPVTPPALEKALGKKAFTEVVGTHVVKKPGKPTAVPETDNRPDYNPAAIAFAVETNE